MKKSRFLSGALALAMTAVTACLPIGVSTVKAAEATDKPDFNFKITGDYTAKKVSEADANVINKAFGYEWGANTVLICGADAKGSIDWDSSAVESWRVYRTEVFQPVFTRDANGNLVVGTDESGNMQRAWSTYATYATETAGVISHQKDLFLANDNCYYGDTYHQTNEALNQGYWSSDIELVTDTYAPSATWFYDYVLSENHFCLSEECDGHTQTINNHLGLTELTAWKPLYGEKQLEMKKYYVSEQTPITDAYVIRVWYTTDKIPLNAAQREFLFDLSMFFMGEVEVVDVYGKSYGKPSTPDEFWMEPILTEDRSIGYTDFWILPESVDTVLTLENISSDGTVNTPGNDNAPGDDTANTPGNDNTPGDGTINTPGSDNTPSDTPNDKISIKKANVTLSKTSYSYNGKEKKPGVSVTVNGKTLVKNKDYTVSYKNNKNIGTATVTVKGKGNYTGTVSLKFKIQLEKGKTFTSGKYKYKVTGTSTVAFNGINSTKTTKITIPKTVTYGGKTFQVTSIANSALKNQKKITSVTIGENVTKIGTSAFYGCKNLKTITIQSEKLKTVGKNALKNIKSTAKIKVPKSKLSAYQKLLKGKGQGSKVKIVTY